MRGVAALLLLLASISCALAAEPGAIAATECIAPAKPGGGFDVTCKLAQAAFAEAKLMKDPMRVTYMPGGIGAVAYQKIITERPGDSSALVAFSGGSLLNIAQGKFGKHTVDDVRWVASIGADFGVVAVRNDAPWGTLKDLMQSLRADPGRVAFGAGGVIGSQDWMKVALVARAAGVSHKTIRFVAFEGGGEAVTALQEGKVQVVSGDAGEIGQAIQAGAPIRLLAVLAPKRLAGALATVPTAREQGFDIRWPVIRGFYVGPRVSDADYEAWVKLFGKLMATPEFRKLREQRGLQPFSMTGIEVEAFVKSSTIGYRQMAKDFGLITP